jgi:hypothetical protein
MKRNQTGFTPVLLIVSLFILASIGIVGWRVYSSQNESSNSQSNTPTSEQDAKTATDTTTESEINKSASELKLLTQSMGGEKLGTTSGEKCEPTSGGGSACYQFETTILYYKDEQILDAYEALTDVLQEDGWTVAGRPFEQNSTAIENDRRNSPEPRTEDPINGVYLNAFALLPYPDSSKLFLHKGTFAMRAFAYKPLSIYTEGEVLFDLQTNIPSNEAFKTLAKNSIYPKLKENPNSLIVAVSVGEASTE